MYASECGVDSKKKIESFTKSHSKTIEIDEFNKCLDGRKYQQECKKKI